jgi:hypothetical protein
MAQTLHARWASLPEVVMKIRTRRQLTRARKQTEKTQKEETFRVEDFRLPRRWRKHSEEMEEMTKGTSGEHWVMRDA